MKFAAAVLLVLLSFAPAVEASDNDPLADAMSRGLVGKPASNARGRKMTPAKLQREQQADMDKSQEIMQRARAQPGLLAQYLYMRSRFDADTDPVFRMVFGQYVSWYQTWIGDYDGARISFSVTQSAAVDDAPSPLEGGYTEKPADQVILELAKGRKAIFFNEAHNAPVTRTLTVELLARLRAEGFNFFAAETLSSGQTDALKRGYPTAQTGFYVNEPIYGEMVRAALHLGYKVIAYDVENGAVDARERGGAQALFDQTLKHDPSARIVVNAGFSHIQKSGSHLGGSSMAETFREISGVEPLSIEQTMMIEHGSANQDHPYYRAVVSRAHPDRAFVFVDGAGKPWTLKPGQYDVSVFFPPERLIENRPDWVGLDGARQPYSVTGDDCHGKSPCLIEARYASEGDDAVAADRVMLDTNPAHSRLYLFPGAYVLTAIDRDGSAIAARNITIDSSGH